MDSLVIYLFLDLLPRLFSLWIFWLLAVFLLADFGGFAEDVPWIGCLVARLHRWIEAALFGTFLCFLLCFCSFFSFGCLLRLIRFYFLKENHLLGLRFENVCLLRIVLKISCKLCFLLCFYCLSWKNC